MYTEHDINTLIEIIKLSLSDKLGRIVLFGSYAKGVNTESSDLDIAILINSIITRKEKLKILNSLWWNASAKGISADFIIKTISDFEIEKNLPTLSKTINKEGRTVWQSS
jgi:predicted nucleotidyltransferase